MELFVAVLVPGQTSAEQQIQRNYKGLKNNYTHVQLRLIMNNKIQKDPKNPMPFWRCWEQRQGTVHDLGTEHHQGVGRPPSHPSNLTPGPATPSPHLKDHLPAPQGVSKEPVTFHSLVLQPKF